MNFGFLPDLSIKYVRVLPMNTCSWVVVNVIYLATNATLCSVEDLSLLITIDAMIHFSAI